MVNGLFIDDQQLNLSRREEVREESRTGAQGRRGVVQKPSELGKGTTKAPGGGRGGENRGRKAPR
jgi:hypothetical protein